MERMVCGFLFDRGRGGVVLIRKERPAWQRGRWNGVGGHIIGSETPAEAMAREFREETGRKIRVESWRPLVTLQGRNGKWKVHFFSAFSDAARATRSMTDELVSIFPVHALPPDSLHNLNWLIPLALDRDVMSGRDVLEITMIAQEGA